MEPSDPQCLCVKSFPASYSMWRHDGSELRSALLPPRHWFWGGSPPCPPSPQRTPKDPRQGTKQKEERNALLSNLLVKLIVGTDLLIFKCLLSICCKVLYIL